MPTQVINSNGGNIHLVLEKGSGVPRPGEGAYLSPRHFGVRNSRAPRGNSRHESTFGPSSISESSYKGFLLPLENWGIWHISEAISNAPINAEAIKAPQRVNFEHIFYRIRNML